MPSSSARFASSSTTSTRTGEPSSRWSRAAAALVFSLMSSSETPGPVPMTSTSLCEFCGPACPRSPSASMAAPQHAHRCGPTVGLHEQRLHAPGPGGAADGPRCRSSTRAAPAARSADVTQPLPAAHTTELPVTPPATPYAYAASAACRAAGPAPIAGPAVPLAPTGPAVPGQGPPSRDGSRWTAKKTAVTAGLALVLDLRGRHRRRRRHAGRARPADDTGFRGPGGGRSFQFPRRPARPAGPAGLQQGQQGQQGQHRNQQGDATRSSCPTSRTALPGGGLGGIDPNQLSQLDPQDLLQQLEPGHRPLLRRPQDPTTA